MPMNLGFFFIRKPRVCQYNAVATKPPSSQGTLLLRQGFRVTYTGGAYSCLLSITGKKFLTIVDESIEHSDNLNIEVIGRNIQELVDEINTNTNYNAVVLTDTGEDFCLFEGVIRTEINGSAYTALYNREKEYLIETSREGKLGNCSISYKEEDFIYSGENSKWMIAEGFIYDAIDVPLASDGLAALGDQGIQIKFFPAIDVNDKDINRIVIFEEEELVQSLDSPISETTFSAAPILMDGTLILKINQQEQEEGVDYIVDYGIPAELRTVNASPYILDNTNNIFRIRHNSLPMQEFVLPIGEVTAAELVALVNQEAKGFQAYSYLDEETRLEYFSVLAERGTFYHQLRIEDGTANSTLGYTDYLAAKGDANGKLLFMTHISSEDISPTEKTSILAVGALDSATDNPFLGVYTTNFKLKENGLTLTKGKDFFVTDGGSVQLVEEIEEEKLLSGILMEDNALFPDSYNVYDNGNKLTVGTDYRVNPQGGWITLMTSAFPGHVYTVDYKHKTEGVIEGEVLLGERANIESTTKAPYSIPLDQFTLNVSINNGATQSFLLPPGNGIVIEDVISSINQTATGFEAYQSKTNVLALRTLLYGPNNSLTILDGSFNSIVGFEDFDSATGLGAEGGEIALQTTHTPMDRV